MNLETMYICRERVYALERLHTIYDYVVLSYNERLHGVLE